MRIGVLNQLVSDLSAIESELTERGELSLFALIEKDDWPEEGSSWHVYATAPWMWGDETAAWKYLRERIEPDQYNLGFGQGLHLSIVPPDKFSRPHLEEIWEHCGTENGIVEIYDVEVLDVTARRGYIFASRRPTEMPELQPREQPATA